MFVHNIDPVLFRIGYLEVRYYGIILAFSVFLGIYLISVFSKQKGLGIDKNTLLEFCFYLVASGLVGARIFYIIFNRPEFYIKNPSEIIAIWRGGLSIHGAIIAGVIAAIIFCKKKKINFYEMADIVVIPLSLGLCFGRIANFLNGELYGRISDVPWAVKFPSAYGFRHPSQLYESFKNLVIFIILWNLNKYNLKKKRFKDGFIFWNFIFIYSVLRFAVEFFRESEFYYFGLSIAQIASIFTAIAAIPFLLKFIKKKREKKEKTLKKQKSKICKSEY